MTNATKANIIAALNAFLGLLIAFNVPLTLEQTGAILAFSNAILLAFVGLTYKDSNKRIPDNTTALVVDGKVKKEL